MSTKLLSERLSAWYMQEENKATDWPDILAGVRALEELLAATPRGQESQAIAHSNALQSLRYELYDAKQAKPDRYGQGYDDGYLEGLEYALTVAAQIDTGDAIWRELQAAIRTAKENKEEP